MFEYQAIFHFISKSTVWAMVDSDLIVDLSSFKYIMYFCSLGLLHCT